MSNITQKVNKKLVNFSTNCIGFFQLSLACIMLLIVLVITITLFVHYLILL